MPQVASVSNSSSNNSYQNLFHNRNFMALWIGQIISYIGDYFVWLSIPIAINRLTGSAMLVGFSTIANALPVLLMGPVAGVFVDRWNRRNTMIAADLVRAGLVLFCLLVSSKEQIWIFYLVGFLMSATSQFFIPARGALLPLIVKEERDWLTANGMMQIIQTVGLLAGPALAGFAIGLWGEKVAFVVNSCGFCVSAIAVSFIRMEVVNKPAVLQPAEECLDAPSTDNTTGIKKIWKELSEGVVYLLSSRTMVGITVCMSVIMLGLGAINVVWVPYLQRTFGIGAEGLGIVDSAQGAGMVLAGLGLGFLASRVSKKMLGSVGILIAGIFLALMGVTNSFYVIVVFSFIIGLAIVPAQSGLNTIMQLAVPDSKRGRVGSSMNAISTAAGLISMAIAAGMGDLIGLSNIYIVFGSVVALSGILGFWLIHEPKSAIREK